MLRAVTCDTGPRASHDLTRDLDVSGPPQNLPLITDYLRTVSHYTWPVSLYIYLWRARSFFLFFSPSLALDSCILGQSTSVGYFMHYLTAT